MEDGEEKVEQGSFQNVYESGIVQLWPAARAVQFRYREGTLRGSLGARFRDTRRDQGPFTRTKSRFSRRKSHENRDDGPSSIPSTS